MTTNELFDKYKNDYHFEEGPMEYLIDEEDFKRALIEFATHHTKNALQAAHENNQLPDEDLEWTMQSYPLDKII